MNLYRTTTTIRTEAVHPCGARRQLKQSHLLVIVVCGLLGACSSDEPGTTIDASSVQLTEIPINGTTLNYMERGQGAPVLLVHGTLGDYRTWDGQIEALSRDHRVISYSRRYHYPNEWPPNASDFSAVLHAEDLAALIEALNLRPVHLVGHSYGAFISLLVAREHPELVRSLTLAEPPVMPLVATTPEGEALAQEFVATAITPSAEAFQRGDVEEGVRTFINGVLGAGAYEDLDSEIRANMMQNARELEGATMDENLFPPFSCEDAGDVSVPTLLVHGELSPRLLVLIQDLLEQCLPNQERAMIPAASHGSVFENPEAFNEAVLAFLARH